MAGRTGRRHIAILLLLFSVHFNVENGFLGNGRRGGRGYVGGRCRGVLRLTVSAQVHLPLEGFLAEAAREGLVAGVFSHMGDQVRRLAERFTAYDTLVRLLTCNGIIQIS